jgi:predicted enzyme related to lactoylglutathione lyase
LEKRARRILISIVHMLKSILISQIFVLDQEEALDFYVGKLGMEVKADADLGNMRWLTVGVPGDNRQILLELPGGPWQDARTAQQVRELVTKGAGGGWIGFTTDDCKKTYESLKAKGVEFTQEPVTRGYGTDVGLRDPFGNNIRITQLAPQPVASGATQSSTKQE